MKYYNTVRYATAKKKQIEQKIQQKEDIKELIKYAVALINVK